MSGIRVRLHRKTIVGSNGAVTLTEAKARDSAERRSRSHVAEYKSSAVVLGSNRSNRIAERVHGGEAFRTENIVGVNINFATLNS